MSTVAVHPSSKKASKTKRLSASHPPYGDMIKHAVKELKERNGSSRQAITKYIKAHYKVDDKAESHIRRALVSAVKSGKLVHTKGIGASGSFKLADKNVKPKAAEPKTVKKPKTPKKTVKKVKTTSHKAEASKKFKTPSKTKAAKPKKAKTPKKPKTLKPKKPIAKKTPKKASAKK